MCPDVIVLSHSLSHSNNALLQSIDERVLTLDRESRGERAHTLCLPVFKTLLPYFSSARTLLYVAIVTLPHKWSMVL